MNPNQRKDMSDNPTTTEAATDRVPLDRLARARGFTDTDRINYLVALAIQNDGRSIEIDVDENGWSVSAINEDGMPGEFAFSVKGLRDAIDRKLLSSNATDETPGPNT